MSFGDAAALPLAAMTCLQALRRYEGDLAGKTVFIPAGCMSLFSLHVCFASITPKITVSGTGSYGCQIAKHIFKAGRVITTVSSSKVPRVEELLGAGVVDESMLS
jgi:NADPH:quinone reductase-like Zn-dependent oxidoreductase